MSDSELFALTERVRELASGFSEEDFLSVIAQWLFGQSEIEAAKAVLHEVIPALDVATDDTRSFGPRK